MSTANDTTAANAGAIVRCPHCNKPNRVRPTPQGTPRCGVCHQPLPWLVEASTETFDAELQASVPVLVDLWAPWCGPCRMMAPALEQLARERAGRLKVVKVNVDEHPQIAARYQVQGIPLLVLTRDGNDLARLTGAAPAATPAELAQQPAHARRQQLTHHAGRRGRRDAARVRPPAHRTPTMSLDIAFKLMPAAGHDASGDFCVVDHRRDGSTLVVLGDADGTDAARHAADVRALVHAVAARVPDPGELLETVNAELVGRAPSASAVAVLTGPAGGKVCWAWAGHPPPRRLDNGAPLSAAPPAAPLGRHAHCGARTRRAPGGIIGGGLLLYTDGLVNATGPHGLRFGEQRLTRALRQSRVRRAGCTLDEIMRTVCHFAAHALPDDAGAVIIRRA